MKQRLTVDDMDVDSNIGNQQRDFEFAPSNTSSTAQPSQLPASTLSPHSGVSCQDRSIPSSAPQSATVSKKKLKKKKKKFIAPPVDPLTQPSYHTQ
ncbi:hypothetical protein BKA69DRAFT_1073477 [Paraphysoderma sedebokerense]|nr:hypothetical protein BKA69DRAFT_1073477 [Paraphysoderma sedebokerense]